MTAVKTINVYCDESCHLENDHIPVMVLGAVYCKQTEVRAISDDIRNLKMKFGISKQLEAKWTKVSPAQSTFYRSLVDLFLNDDRLFFRGVIVPDKTQLDHGRFDQTHDDWYYKMYYILLRYIFHAPNRYRIYIDVKDTQGGPKIRKLQEVLSNKLHDFNHETIERVQQVRSHESEILQLTDLLIGALAYENRKLNSSPAKVAILAQLKDSLGPDSLSSTSNFSQAKFNVLVWNASGAKS